MKLSDLQPGQARRIMSVSADREVRIRLIEMGFIPGMRVAVRSVDEASERMELWVRGNNVMLQREEADCVRIEEGS